MITLLFMVLILGVIAWAISVIPMPSPFKTVAYVILAVILIVVLFNALGANTGLNLN